jgi:hypothetical protein
MAEVESKYRCPICNVNELTHDEWKDHQLYDEHRANVKRLLKNKYYCKKCEYQFETQRLFERHCESDKHKGLKMTKEQLYCKKCDIQCDNKAKWDDHILTKKHLNDKKKKTKEELCCLKCNTQCHNDSEWEKHLKTKKHIRNTNTNGTEIPRAIQQTSDQGSQTD